MSAKAYLAAIMPLVERLGQNQNIMRAGQAAATAWGAGGKVWVSETTHCLHDEATHRAGGPIAVHALLDPVIIQPLDCVIEGTPVGTGELAIDIALQTKSRGATLVALTNVAFENDARTILEHPTQKRLHEIADIVVDLGGPLGDGVFEQAETNVRVMPHSGVVGMTAMWMIFAEAMALLESEGKILRCYESIMIEGARGKNAEQAAEYVETLLAYVPAKRDELRSP